MTPETLAELVRGVERVERMLGSTEKRPVEAEEQALRALRVNMHEVGFD